MVHLKSKVLAAIVIALLGIGPVQATVLTFDNLGPDGPIPSGYGGFDWANFEFLDGINFDHVSPSGYLAGVVSPNNVAFNANSEPAIVSIIGGDPFNFVGAYLTAAWNDNLNVRIQGFSVAAPIYDTTVTLSATTSTFVTLNFAGVDQLLFTSSGGTPHPGYTDGGLQFVMDNFTFTMVPEPSSLLLGGFGLSALAIACRTGRRK